MSDAFEKFMGEYAEKQAGCYGSGEPTADDPVNEDSCGTCAEVGKVGPGEAESSAQSPRSESQQNCAGLGAEWGIPPAGMNLEAAILAQTRMLLSRSLAYVGLQDLKCARQLAVEIRDHMEAIEAYAFSKGIAWEVAAAMIQFDGHSEGLKVLKQRK